MEVFNTFIVLILSAIILIWLLLKQKFNYWKRRGLPTLPYSLIWGNVKPAIFQQNSVADRVQSYYEGFKSQGIKHGGLYFLWNPMYVPMETNVIKSIMQTDFHHFVDRGIYYDEKNDPLSSHLFSLTGKKWKLLRNKLSPTFTSGKMKMMYETLAHCTIALCKVMDKNLGKAVDIKDILGRFTTDLIGSCVFGLDCNSLENPNSEFRKNGIKLFHRKFPDNIRVLASIAVPQIARTFKMKLVPSDLNNFFMSIVKDTVAYREENNIFRKDLMHLLIQLKNRGQLVEDEKLSAEKITEEENKISLNELAAQAFVFFEAGFETSSTTMTFCLYVMAKNKDVQEKVREEIQQALDDQGQLTYEALMGMNYLERVINETLRIYPPVTSLFRICTEEYKVPGTDIVLEKGVRVLIPVYGMHHDPDYFPNPKKFDPDRFTEENKRKRPAFSYLPFGDGPRVCIGARFGMMQTKLGLCALILNYEFSVSDKTKEPLEFDTQSLTISTKGGMWLNYKKISKNTIHLLNEQKPTQN